MYLIARNVNGNNYLTAYDSKELADTRLDVFIKDGDKAFIVEVVDFDYSAPSTGMANGLVPWHPAFTALVVDFEAETIAWDSNEIEKQVEQRKETLRNNLANYCNEQYRIIQSKRNVFRPTKSQSDQYLDTQEQDLMTLHDSMNNKIETIDSLVDVYRLELEMVEHYD
ncbi:hypothetical protein K6327_000928 [Vibrio vulnificus]|nr:hypothetical protein [Vibrio vulnificus]